jgi:hypothetical protein
MTNLKKITLIIEADDERFKGYPDTITIDDHHNDYGKLEKTKRYLERGLRSYVDNTNNIHIYKSLKQEIEFLENRLSTLNEAYCFIKDRYMRGILNTLKSYEFSEEYQQKKTEFDQILIEYNTKIRKYESWHGKTWSSYYDRFRLPDHGKNGFSMVAEPFKKGEF